MSNKTKAPPHRRREAARGKQRKGAGAPPTTRKSRTVEGDRAGSKPTDAGGAVIVPFGREDRILLVGEGEWAAGSYFLLTHLLLGEYERAAL